MAENIQWAPYLEKMTDQLVKLPAAELTSWQGRPLSDIAGILQGSLHAFSMEKVEKICLGSFRINENLQLGICSIFPKIEYRLPVFMSRWEEKKDEIVFLVDMLPTVDFFLDKEFREKYLEPMGPLWEKFASLPGIWPEEDDALRSACSIIYTAARVPIEREGMRLAALAPHTEYLSHYIEFIKAASPLSDETKKNEVQKKTQRVKAILCDYFREAFKNPPLNKVFDAGAAEAALNIFF